MNERVKKLGQLAKARFSAMNQTERLRMGAVVVLGIVALSAGLGWLTRTNWQPLYTNLAPQSAGQITNQLTQMKIPYQLADQGRTVLVPQKDVDQVRVDLADHNIPSQGTVGMPAPTTFSLGETNQEIQMQQLVNLEAQLEQTINSINGVKSSRVTINEPPPALFGEGTSSPTAAVFVVMSPGNTLSSAAVRGIMNLVAHSVSGLNMKSVAVVDQTGTVLSSTALSATSTSTFNGQTESQLSAQKAVDDQIAAGISSMLDQVLGPGHAVVRVNAALNFNSSTVKDVTYGNKVLSQQQVTQNSSSGTGTTLPQAGAGGNVPSYPTVTGGGSQSSKQNSTINKYLVSQKQTSQTVPPGAISRMTVAVAVDQALTPAQKTNLQQLVSQAAGINTSRGDQVYIMGQPFNHQLVTQELAKMAQAQSALRMRREIEAGVALLAAIGLLILIRRSLGASRERAALTGLDLFDVPAISIEEVMAAAPAAESPSPPNPALDLPRQHLVSLLKREPETVANLLRSWIDEDE